MGFCPAPFVASFNTFVQWHWHRRSDWIGIEEHRHAAGSRSHRPGFPSARGTGSDGLASRLPRPARHPGVLSGGLESGVWRSAWPCTTSWWTNSSGSMRRSSACRSTASGAIRRLLTLADCAFRCSLISSRKGVSHGCTASYREEDGTSERALFVLDAAGIVRWSYVSPVGVNPGADGILEALESLVAFRSRR